MARLPAIPALQPHTQVVGAVRPAIVLVAMAAEVQAVLIKEMERLAPLTPEVVVEEERKKLILEAKVVQVVLAL